MKWAIRKPSVQRSPEATNSQSRVVERASARQEDADARRDSVPLPASSETRIRACVIVAGIGRAAERARAGDFHGALAAAMYALDGAPVPILHASPTYLAKARLTSAQRMLLLLVDGRTSLEEIIEAAGLGLLEGLEAFAELLEAGLVGFDPEDRGGPPTIPSIEP
jgi:hypothetical protein